MIDNINSTFDENYTTDADGWVRWIALTERVQNSSGNVSCTPYNVTVTKPGYLDGHAEVDINQSTELAITLTTDDSSPMINHINPLTAKTNQIIGISANVSDDIGVADAKLYYQNVGDTAYTPVNMILITGNPQSGDWAATIPAQAETGLVHYFIWANDTWGNNATSPAMGDYAIQITGPPSIEITKPFGDEIWTGASIHQIEFAAFDTEDAIADLDVFLNYTSSTGNGVIAHVKGDGSPCAWLLPPINSTDVKVNATVIDTDGNKAYDDSPQFTIDSSPPEVISSDPANGSVGVPTNELVVIHFNEMMNVSSVSMVQSDGNDPGGWSWFWNAGGDTVTGLHNPWSRGEIVEMTVQAGYKDGSDPGNANGTAYIFSFQIETNPPPEINHSGVSGPRELGDTVKVDANITDDRAVTGAILRWQDVKGIWHESGMNQRGSEWEYTIPGQMEEGMVRYQINATDDLGQVNSTTIYEFDIEDTAPPTVVHSPIGSAVLGERVNMTCLATDLGGVSAVYLYYRNDGTGNFTFVTMNPGYWYVVAAPTEYFFTAFDVYGNSLTTETYEIYIINPNVQDTTSPEILLAAPNGNNVSVTANITIVFNEPMNRSSVENAISISPALHELNYIWPNNQTLVITLSSNLPFNTTFSLSVGNGARDLAGNGLSSAHYWNFTTESEPVNIQANDNYLWLVIILILIVAIIAIWIILRTLKRKDPDE